MKDTRYPYTYAADFIRGVAGYNKEGTKLSRSDASVIRCTIAEVLGLHDDEVACKIADHYLANKEKIDQEAADAASHVFAPQFLENFR
jgi:hypothetical protein